MSNDPKDTGSLKAAYDLSTPEDNRRLYRDWAATYDTGFMVETGYEYPARIAALFEARGGVGPVLDVGCGTGAVAQALRVRPVDGVDISPEMLVAARDKGIYRTLIEADLTATPKLPKARYAGVVSSGTFTHGHVGPEALETLVQTARTGALFVIGINAEIFAQQPFAQILGGLVADGEITEPETVEGRIYSRDATHEHADDLFRAVVFHRK
ncbi:MAG: class I SAM-dependent DNA methyltransferase [Pikeienuella sp.]